MVIIVDVHKTLARRDRIVRGYSESFLFAETKARGRHIAARPSVKISLKGTNSIA